MDSSMRCAQPGVEDVGGGEEPCRSLKNLWVRIVECPACRCERSSCLGKLVGNEYHYRNWQMPFPPEGVSLLSCASCGLVYKSNVLSSEELLRICEKIDADVWPAGYDFKEEVRIIRELVGRDEFDLLDIGAAGGWLLKASAPCRGRRSAVDLAKSGDVAQYIRGEFIRGSLDGRSLDWSGEPYDVVTLFDVAEHFHDAEIAFSRLAVLVKEGGFVVLETGDATSFWPVHLGVQNWWYAQRFPHNMFWSERPLKAIACRHGFEVLRVERKRNKNLKQLSPWGQLKACGRSFTYGVSPRLYGWLLRRSGNAPIQPCSCISPDHIRIVMRLDRGRASSNRVIPSD